MQQQPDSQMPYQSVPVSSDELYANAVQEDKIKNIVSQLDPENQLKEIEMRIRGYKRNVFTRDWEKIDPESPEPPKLLISRFISYLSSIMNQNTTQGNLSDRQINALMSQAVNYTADELDGNSAIYNLDNNYTERTRIGHIMLNSMFFTLNRSLNGQEGKRMWKAMTISDNLTQDDKGKFGEALKFWK